VGVAHEYALYLTGLPTKVPTAIPQDSSMRRGGRILAWIGHLRTHSTAIEVANSSVAPNEHAEAGHIVVVGVGVNTLVVAGHVGHKREVVESALLFVVNQPLYGRSRRD
jgi:hypothetical protein